MSKFRISANPCVILEDGVVQTIITTQLIKTKLVIDCALKDLQAELIKLAPTIENTEKEHFSVNIHAYPEGRAPNGYKTAEAQDLNSYIDKRVAPAQ